MRISLLLVVLSFVATAFAEVSTFGILGDAGFWNETNRKVRDHLARDRVKSLILPGDNLYDLNIGYDATWRPWRDLGFRFDVVALGNHHDGYAKEMAYFGMPGEFFEKSVGNARFLVLNSDNEKNVPQQARWLRERLSAAQPSEALFIVFHHPPLTLTDRHKWEEKKDFHHAIRPLLVQFRQKIRALIVGHDHIASLVEWGGIPIIVSGSAFESLPAKSITGIMNGQRYISRWVYPGGPHWVRLDVSDENNQETWVNFVDVGRNRVNCSVRIYPRPFLSRPNCAATSARFLTQN